MNYNEIKIFNGFKIFNAIVKHHTVCNINFHDLTFFSQDGFTGH
jgi:hypothetical protein